MGPSFNFHLKRPHCCLLRPFSFDQTMSCISPFFVSVRPLHNWKSIHRFRQQKEKKRFTNKRLICQAYFLSSSIFSLAMLNILTLIFDFLYFMSIFFYNNCNNENSSNRLLLWFYFFKSFSTPTFADGFSLKFEWQQVSPSHQDSS